MNTWTAGAKAELEKYLAAIRRPLEQAGADAVEVIEDLKRHIEADIAAAQLRVVTVTDLKPMLARIGEPLLAGQPSMNAFTALGVTSELAPAELPVERGNRQDFAEGPKVRPPEKPGALLLITGVVLPAAILLFEWASGFCARHFFNPIPSVGHVLLVALVPIVNGYVWRALRKGELKHARAVSWLLAFTLGIAVIYSAVFLPLVLPALFALIFFGLGLLPLTPLMAAVSTGVLRKRVRLWMGRERCAGAWAGMLLAAVAFLLVDIRYVATTIGLQMAKENAGAVSWLRRFGDEETLLRACRPQRANFSNLAPLLFMVLPREYQVTADEAQRVYFQVYGRSFNSVPAPRERTTWVTTPDLFSERAVRGDWDRGGEKVGSPVPGLSLRTSRLDATAEPNAALAYLEWIFEFKNDASGQAEARCEILLPPEALVSRLTLWVNGEEREAAFAGRSEVRQAYQNIVAARRDPVLITTSGRDAILMQCFPVPPNGGVMKVRVGMTVPLQLDANKNGVLRWPVIRERNFALDEKLEQTFWLDSPKPLEALGVPLQVERTKSGHFMAHGTYSANDESVVQPAVLIRRDHAPDQAWVRDTRQDDGSLIVQQIEALQSSEARDIVLVLDGSAATGRNRERLKEVSIPKDLRVVVAGEHIRDYKVANSNDWMRVLNETAFIGGQDNVPALQRGWELAAEHGAGVLIWVHGPQPIALSSVEGLKQRFERRRSAVELLDMPLERAPNAILKALPTQARWRSVSMHEPVERRLSVLLQELSGQAPRYARVLDRKATAPQPTGGESNLHLARAWANEEIKRLTVSGQREEAVRLAGLYQLVTEVSGAVVLETAEQFQRAGLQPVDPKTVPVVPEPGTWALLLVGLGAMLFQGRVKTRVRK